MGEQISELRDLSHTLCSPPLVPDFGLGDAFALCVSNGASQQTDRLQWRGPSSGIDSGNDQQEETHKPFQDIPGSRRL